jgi:E3 ubiquitin-protein ligase HERC4
MQDAMNNAVHRVITQMFFSNMESASISQFLDIHVSRDNIVEDTIRELSEHSTNDLKKPLRVRFALSCR